MPKGQLSKYAVDPRPMSLNYILLLKNFTLRPSVSTIYRTFKMPPINDKRKKYIKRYEKRYPGEALYSDTYSLPKTLVLDRKKWYLFDPLDDCV